MLEQLNYLAVLVAAVAGMVVGFVWFEALFKAKWRAATGRAPSHVAV